jgi:RNA polymerase sigma factor (sigma-70 family)
MDNRSDIELLREYSRDASDSAFAALVSRYLNLVYSAALRQVCDPHVAEEVSHATFIVLARKAPRLNERVVLSAWLYRTACFVAADALKTRSRRLKYEREAAQMEPTAGESPWETVAPFLDRGLQQLSDKDRAAVLLRFFENKSLREVGSTLGLNEDAAQKRVSRALDKLRAFFANRGLTLSGTGLATALSTQAVVQAPKGLVPLVVAAVTSKGAVAASTAALVSGTLKIILLKQLQTAATVAVITLLAGGAVFIAAQSGPTSSERALAIEPRFVFTNENGLLPPEALRELVELGHVHGHNGDWAKAFDCFRRVITSGLPVEEEFLWATGAALAAGEVTACEEFCRNALLLFGQDTDPGVAERCAKQCLVLPNLAADLLAQAAQRADFAFAEARDSRWKQFAKGMADYRRGNWSQALQWLEQPERTSQIEIAIQAGSFGAMARHRLGDAVGARKALDQVSRQMKVMVQTGQLCHPRYNSWDNFARALALRAEAERLILGREVSPRLDPPTIVRNRKLWSEVEQRLESAEQLAKQARWQEAAEAYSSAIAHSAFDWSVSEVRQDILAQEIAVTFLLAENTARHRALSQTLLDRDWQNLTPIMQERYASVVLAHTGHLPAEIKKRGLKLARLASQRADAENNPWLWLLRGLADYREHRYEDAIAALTRAQFAGDPVAEARALAFQAMARHKLGDIQQATETAKRAEARFASTSGAAWGNIAFYELAKRELRSILPISDQQ